MSEPRDHGDSRRLDELLRVNSELAAEVRQLALGLADAPRSTALPTSRRLGQIIGERDALLREAEVTAAELAAVRAELAAVRAQLASSEDSMRRLELQNQELLAEVIRLRTGLGGLARRLRARLLGS